MNTLKGTLALGFCMTIFVGLSTRADAEPMKPMTEADLMHLIRLGVSEEQTVSRLNALGIDFAVTDAVVERLKKAKASPGVLDAVKRLGAKKPAAGPERK